MKVKGSVIALSPFIYRKGKPPKFFNHIYNASNLPNPNKVIKFRELDGKDLRIRSWLKNKKSVRDFLEQTASSIIDYAGDSNEIEISIGIGCISGLHRPVAVVEILFDYLDDLGFTVFKNI